jgi:hypothetical protein
MHALIEFRGDRLIGLHVVTRSGHSGAIASVTAQQRRGIRVLSIDTQSVSQLVAR